MRARTCLLVENLYWDGSSHSSLWVQLHIFDKGWHLQEEGQDACESDWLHFANPVVRLTLASGGSHHWAL